MAHDRAARPQARSLRLFVAVDVPDEVRELVRQAVAPLRERFPRARWVPPQNQHVTVKFLGATWPRLVEPVKRAIAQVAAGQAPFRTRVSGLGAFPSARRARVLWASLEDPEGRLAAIAQALDAALAADFRPETRPFTAHLTVARFEPTVPLEDLAEIALDTPSFTVEAIVLYRSHLRRPAPVYEPLEIFPLGPGR
jgi:2'-5' RNA ligase